MLKISGVNIVSGAITAAQFLSEFVGDTPWVHLDIAGTNLSEKERTYLVKGATGVPVRTLVNLVLSLAKYGKRVIHQKSLRSFTLEQLLSLKGKGLKKGGVEGYLPEMPEGGLPFNNPFPY